MLQGLNISLGRGGSQRYKVNQILIDEDHLVTFVGVGEFYLLIETSRDHPLD